MTGPDQSASESGPVHGGHPVAAAICRLANRYVEECQHASGSLPVTTYAPDWPSLCVQQVVDHTHCLWRPVPMASPPPLGGLADALDVSLHADWRALFGAQWSAGLPLEFNGGRFELLQLWNEQDAENLVANHIGHALEKRRVRQPLTLFFGLVDDDRLLSIDNTTGAVQLEILGTRGPLDVAPDLVTFLAGCTPVVPEAT